MHSKNSGTETESELFGNLLDERLLWYRRTDTGERVAASLPEIFIAMEQDNVRDFPSLRPHQRHPWHAFLVQLAALALHHGGGTKPYATVAAWRAALLALTPNDLDGAAWCLVSPVNKPAFMQPPEPSGSISNWKNCLVAVDELDMLVTSKNHDLKTARMSRNTAEEWVYALISLQTQEGFLGAGNYGISRMNGGFASRCGVGIHPAAGWGGRWRRDVEAVTRTRAALIDELGFSDVDGHTLIWTIPWDGSNSLSFTSLDPWYIEVCRRCRVVKTSKKLCAFVMGSKVPRIAAQDRNGITGDPWMPVRGAEAKALTIGRRGFDYKLAAELLFGSKLTKPTAQTWLDGDDKEGVYLIAQGVARGQGKTEGYHERRIPISKNVRKALLSQNTDELAKVANERIAAITAVSKMLWASLVVLFGKAARDEAGKDKDTNDTIKNLASHFSETFESDCDKYFFSELTEEIEVIESGAVRNQWLLILVDRAESILKAAFIAGPRSGQLRYRAQSVALDRLRSMMYSDKFPALAQALKLKNQNLPIPDEKESHEHA